MSSTIDEFTKASLAKWREHMAAMVPTAARLTDAIQCLRETRNAINPKDLHGISLHEWNQRLKKATAEIDRVLTDILT